MAVASAQQALATSARPSTTCWPSWPRACPAPGSLGEPSTPAARPALGQQLGPDGAGGGRRLPGSSTASSSDLIARQKAVDAAAADVAVAEQDLAQSTIVSPISGTVVAVTLAVGDEVSAAASTTAHIVVVGAGGFEVTTTVSVDHIPDVKVGQPATVLPDGATDPIDGQVVAIALTPTTATSGTTYRVTIGLDDQGAGLGNGATGSVSIVTAGVTSASRSRPRPSTPTARPTRSPSSTGRAPRAST